MPRTCPTEGAAILASNHLAVIDSFFLPLVLDREIVFIGKAEYFTGAGVKGRLTAGFMRGVGTIPVDRGGGKASEAALRTGLRRLEDGRPVRHLPRGHPQPRRSAVPRQDGRRAARAGVRRPGDPGRDGRHRRWRSRSAGVIPKPMRIGVVIGEPLDFSRYKGMENDRFILRSVTDEIMYALMSLSGQEYVDMYAATAEGPHRRPVTRPSTGAAADHRPGRAGRSSGARTSRFRYRPQDEAGPSVG